MIAVIDYGMGNLRSVSKAVECVGGEVLVTRDPRQIACARKIILPGVGAFAQGMANLRRMGLVEILEEQVLKNRKPFWGICLGMQLLARKSDEFGETPGLGWLDAEIVRFPDGSADFRIPHVGWNGITVTRKGAVFSRTSSGDTFYFVHSYFMRNNEAGDVAATAHYGADFTAAVRRNNIFATQFHPEKSQENGLDMLTEFVNWDGK